MGRATHAYGMIIHKTNATAAIRPMQARTKPPRYSRAITVLRLLVTNRM